MRIKNEAERQKFLELNIKGAGSYALVTYDNKTEPIWISRYVDWNENGNWFLESPCILMRYKFEDNSEEAIRLHVEELYEPDFVEEEINNIKSMIRDGWLYEIESPQIDSCLPAELEDLTLISESYCLEWMLNNSKVTVI